MSDILQFPTRGLHGVRVVPGTTGLIDQIASNAASRNAFMVTPRGRFLLEVRRLSDSYPDTAERILAAYYGTGGFTGFQRVDRVPDPTSMGHALMHLATIPDGDAIARGRARIAAEALVALAFPFDEPSRPVA